MKKFNKTQKLTISAVCMALYIVLMLCTQSFAFGQYQIRIATALYGLSALFPFLAVPLSLANVISNFLMGGLGILDMLGGAIVGIVTTGGIVWAKRNGCGNWCVFLAVTLVPGLGVPMWLSVLLDIPYWILASSILVGQTICGIFGMALVSALERNAAFNVVLERK